MAICGTFLQQRIRDGVVLRLIGKWLNAGVMEDGAVTHPEAGSPQGGVISPLLANVYLHYVLDEWFAQEVQPRLKGRAYVVRYADDFVIGFTDDEDARRVMDVLPKRFGKYGLTIHPDKTRLVPFQRPTTGDGEQSRRIRLTAMAAVVRGVSTFWAYPFLGLLAERHVDLEAEDGSNPDASDPPGVLRLVPGASSRPSFHAATGLEPETPRSRRLLRRDGQCCMS